LLVLGLALFGSSPRSGNCAQGGAAPAKGKWTLSTADTRLVVGVSAGDELRLVELASPDAGWNWARAAHPFPLMGRADMGGISNALHWRFAGAETDGTPASRVTLRFTNAAPPLELTSTWSARPGPGPIRHTQFIRNRADRVVTIYEQESLDLRLTAPENTLAWYFNDDGSLPDKVGVYRERVTGDLKKSLTISEEQDFIPFAYLDANGAHGMYLGWEWSIGRVALHGGGRTGEVRLQCGNREDFRTDLAPGEMFEVPPAFVGAYRGDVDDGGNSLRQYLFRYSMPALIRDDTGFPKVEWNAFAPTGLGQGSWVPSEKKYYPFIEDIAPLGFEEVVIDVGWWSSYGDPGHIVTNPTNWPGGMKAAAQYARDRGLRFGLYDNETEDLTTEHGIRERIADVTYLIKELGADFYRSDSTAGPVLKGAPGGAGRARYPEDVGYWATKGFYRVIDTLYAELPGFLWECCSGGGRIKDFGVARRAGRIQNQDRYYPLDARQSFFDSSHVLHPMQLAALDGSWAEWQATGSVFEFRSASMGVPYWHPDAPNGGNGGPVWSDPQKAQIKKAVATYKTRIRPLVRNGVLYHIFPRPDGVVWDGIQYFDAQRQEGVVYIFKPNSPSNTQVIRLKGLHPKTNYRLTFEDETNPPASLPGDTLMRDGITVKLEGAQVSELMFISGSK
jgi:hypothetical protein